MKGKGSVLTQFPAEELCEGSSIWLNRPVGQARPHRWMICSPGPWQAGLRV